MMGYHTELTVPNLPNSLPNFSKISFFYSFLPRGKKRTLLMEQYKYHDDWSLISNTHFTLVGILDQKNEAQSTFYEEKG